jgi:hypothetical protein
VIFLKILKINRNLWKNLEFTRINVKDATLNTLAKRDAVLQPDSVNIDAYESIFIRKRQKENVELLNEDDGNVNSKLFDLIF